MKKKICDILLEFIPYLIIIVVVLLVKEFIVAPIKVNGASMDDTLNNNDIMLLDKISYRNSEIKRFDIVVIKNDGEYIIKRIIGLPGEKVEYKEDKLFINGKEIEEPFEHSYTEDFDAFVAEDNYFVLGDNRVVSMDSREFGAFSKEQIIGKTNLVIFPFDRFGNKK